MSGTFPFPSLGERHDTVRGMPAVTEMPAPLLKQPLNCADCGDDTIYDPLYGTYTCHRCRLVVEEVP